MEGVKKLLNGIIRKMNGKINGGMRQTGGDTVLIDEKMKENPYINLTEEKIFTTDFRDDEMKYIIKNPELLGYEPLFGNHIREKIYKLYKFAEYLDDKVIMKVLNTFYKMQDNGSYLPDRKTQILGFLVQSGYYSEWMYMVFDIFINTLNENTELDEFNKEIINNIELANIIKRKMGESVEYKCILICMEIIIEKTNLNNIREGLKICEEVLEELKKDDKLEGGELEKLYMIVRSYSGKELKKISRDREGVIKYVVNMIGINKEKIKLTEKKIEELEIKCDKRGHKCNSIHEEKIYDKMEYKTITTIIKKMEELTINVIRGMILNSMRINVYPAFMISGLLSGYYFDTVKLYYTDENHEEMYEIYKENVRKMIDKKYMGMRRNEYEYTHIKKYFGKQSIKLMSENRINLYSEVSKAKVRGIKFSACMEVAILNLIRVLKTGGTEPKNEKYKEIMEYEDAKKQIDSIALLFAEEESLKKHLVRVDHELNATNGTLIDVMSVIYDIPKMENVSRVLLHLNRNIGIIMETEKMIKFKIGNTILIFSYDGGHGVIKYDEADMYSKCIFDETILDDKSNISYILMRKNRNIYRGGRYQKEKIFDGNSNDNGYRLDCKENSERLLSQLDGIDYEEYCNKYVYCNDMKYVKTNLMLIEYEKEYLDNKILNGEIFDNQFDEYTSGYILLLVGYNFYKDDEYEISEERKRYRMREELMRKRTKEERESEEKEMEERNKKEKRRLKKIREEYLEGIIKKQKRSGVAIINKNVLNIIPYMIKNPNGLEMMDIICNLSEHLEQFVKLDLSYDEETLSRYIVHKKFYKLVVNYEEYIGEVKYGGQLLDNTLQNSFTLHSLEVILETMDKYGYKFTKDTMNMLFNVSLMISDREFDKIFEEIKNSKNVGEYYNDTTLELAFESNVNYLKKLLELENEYGKKYEEKTINKIAKKFMKNKQKIFEYDVFIEKMGLLIEYVREEPEKIPKNFVSSILDCVGNYRLVTNLEQYMRVYEMLKNNFNIYVPENIAYVYLTNSIKEVNEYYNKIGLDYDSVMDIYCEDFIYDGVSKVDGIDILQGVYKYELVKKIIKITKYYMKTDEQYTALLLRMLCRKEIVSKKCGSESEYDVKLENDLLKYIIDTNKEEFKLAELPFNRYVNWLISSMKIMEKMDIVFENYGEEFMEYIKPQMIFWIRNASRGSKVDEIEYVNVILKIILKGIGYLSPRSRTNLITKLINILEYNDHVGVLERIIETVDEILDKYEYEYIFDKDVLVELISNISKCKVGIVNKIFNKIKTESIEYDKETDKKIFLIYDEKLKYIVKDCKELEKYLKENKYLSDEEMRKMKEDYRMINLKRGFGRRAGF
jgi:hypothetical protein